jgi:competence protein ComEA
MNGSWLDRNRNVVFSLLSVAAVGGAAFFYLQQPKQDAIELLPAEPTAAPTATITPAPDLTPTPALVRVYITGAVVKSDVYFLPQGSIIKDAIAAAGGLTSEADLIQINQAQELADQQHIHVPKIGEENPPPPVQNGQNNAKETDGGPTSPGSEARINLNTATLEQLDQLPGIGPALAQRIIDYRETVGPFTDIEQITEVSGIGDATFSKLKDLITVE